MGEKVTQDGQWSMRDAISDHAKAEREWREKRGERVTQEQMEKVARDSVLKEERRKKENRK